MAKRASKTKQPPKQISGPQDAKYNPRRIADDADVGLQRSIYVFGPLDGFVINLETGNVICGHQRRRHVREMGAGAITWSEQYEVEIGPKEKRFVSRERSGQFVDGRGARWSVRAVRWPLWFEQAANLAANSEDIIGEFVWEGVASILQGLKEQGVDLSMTGFLPHTYEPLIEADWTPPPLGDMPTALDHGAPIQLSKEQREVVDKALDKAMGESGLGAGDEGARLVVICEFYLRERKLSDSPKRGRSK